MPFYTLNASPHGGTRLLTEKSKSEMLRRIAA